jgi:hypothetical protein
VPQEAELIDYEVDHIIAEQHSGKTELGNLAYACFDCNRCLRISSTSASFNRAFGFPSPELFKQRPSDHDAEGRATSRLFHFNDPTRVQQRADLIIAGGLNP